MRNSELNQGFVALPDVAEEVVIAGVIVVTMNQDGTFGTHFKAEDLDEIPPVEVQLDLGSTIAAAWAAASIASVAD